MDYIKRGEKHEGRPIWKPMHGFVTREDDGRAMTNAYIASVVFDVGADIFGIGRCLPSDNKMMVE